MKPFGAWPHAWISSKLQRLFALLLVKLGVFDFVAVDRDKIPKKGGVIIICNHPTNAEPPMLLMAIPRLTIAVAKHQLWQGPLAPYMIGHGHIAIKRGNAKSAQKTRRRMLRVCQAKLALLNFPEGGSSHPDGTMKPFKSGPFDISLETGVPIIAAGIAGTRELWPQGKRLWNRKKPVRLVFGELLDPANFTNDRAGYVAAGEQAVLQSVLRAEALMPA